MSATSPTDALSYYGRPIIKEPVWESDIPLYFFTGGLAGASDLLALGAQLSGNPRLRTSALAGATAGVAISPYFLIKDLGRPLRFLNMLRVFKVTSPMSVGTWIFSAESTATGIAAACRLFGVLPRVRAIAQVFAGLIGPAQATYTGALIAQSVVPAWHEARLELPVVFASSAAASAGGAAAILTPAEHAGPARRLGLIGGVAEVAASKLMEKRLGKLVGSVYHEGEAGKYSRLAAASTLAGSALMALAGRRRVGAIAAGALLLTGSLCNRFAVYHAGKQSARDPHHTSIPQKERGGRAIT
ncbi:MAG: polysulfide reductase [Actinobacteria bacterium]|nr:MAG: polysulfide reductase [Actinomycetota bacterium]